MSTAKVESLKMQIFIGKWDITEFVLGGSVSKSLGQPLGQWQLRCRPILQNGRVFDTDQIYPMDYVEIRVGRPKPGEPIPILTRGFVSAIDIDDGVSQDLSGSPQRAITISGHDLTKAIVGKMLKNTVDETVGNQNTKDRTDDLLFLEKFFRERNKGNTTLGLSNFVETVMKYVFYDRATGMQLINNFQFQIKTNLPKKYESKEVGDGTSSTASDTSIISPDLLNIETVGTIQNFAGNLWSYLQSYCPKPIIEMFVEDNEENSTFNVRWSPYRTILNWSSNKAANLYFGSRPNEYPKRVVENTESTLEATWFNPLEGPTKSLISINEIMNIKVRRHDNDRFTYFICMYKNWRYNGPTGAVIAPNKNDPWRTAAEETAVKSEPGAESYSNKNYGVNPYYDFPGIAKFGLKSFQFNAPFTPYIIQTTEQKSNADKEMIKLFAAINFWAVQAFAGIDTLYSGMIVMRGCPFVKVGQELYIDRNINSSFQYKDVTKNDEYPNAKTEQYYVESVEHAWQIFPNPQFTTRLGVTRGVNIGKITAPFVNGGSGFTVKTDQSNLYSLTPDQLSKLSSDKIMRKK